MGSSVSMSYMWFAASVFQVIHHRPETQKGRLDFGTLGVGERRSMKFTLRNDNPVDVSII